jgi:hypothetical protein
MSGLKRVFVDCVRDGQVVASYDFGYAETQGPSMPPNHQSLIAEAKTNLTNQAIAYPPYAGIEFKVRWPS